MVEMAFTNLFIFSFTRPTFLKCMSTFNPHRSTAVVFLCPQCTEKSVQILSLLIVAYLEWQTLCYCKWIFPIQLSVSGSFLKSQKDLSSPTALDPQPIAEQRVLRKLLNAFSSGIRQLELGIRLKCVFNLSKQFCTQLIASKHENQLIACPLGSFSHASLMKYL